MKITYTTLPPKRIIYRPLRNMNEDLYLEDLRKGLGSIPIGDFSSFYATLIAISDNHAQTKTKIVRGNDKPFMTKAFRK